jgi:hypothetical protein
LLGHSYPEGQWEATLASHLAMAVLLELNARNTPVILEKHEGLESLIR